MKAPKTVWLVVDKATGCIWSVHTLKRDAKDSKARFEGGNEEAKIVRYDRKEK